MADQDPNQNNDLNDSIEKVDTSAEPELLGVELSEELKKDPAIIDEVVAPEPVQNQEQPQTETPVEPVIEKKEYDVEIEAPDDSPPVPKKEFSMPEQTLQVEEVVDGYVSNPAIANSSR